MLLSFFRPNWPAPPHVHSLCTTRAGGVSAPPFNSLNLGDHVGDSPSAVQANRTKLQAILAEITPNAQAIFLHQVHGTQVATLERSLPQGSCADAAITTERGMVCTIMVADCLPVLFTNRQGTVVAGAHAGWRGLAGVGGTGVLEATFKRFMALALEQQGFSAIKNIAPMGDDILAWLGPCIGPRAFEVGAEVRDAFCSHDSAAAQFFQKSGCCGGENKFLADLAGLAHFRLKALGIHAIYGNDSSPDWCTVGNPLRFFSHRQGQSSGNGIGGGSGRIAACIWLG